MTNKWNKTDFNDIKTKPNFTWYKWSIYTVKQTKIHKQIEKNNDTEKISYSKNYLINGK